MTVRYFEARRQIDVVDTTIAADIMRHFHARQHLGKALVICSDPAAMLTATHKQWLKLSRNLQRRRSAAVSADEILRFTYTITQMQHLEVVAEKPDSGVPADIYIMRADELGLLPADCMTVYLVRELPDIVLPQLITALPASSLLVDYYDQVQRGNYGLKPRVELESRLATTWSQVEEFLAGHHINLRQLSEGHRDHGAAFNDALDTLLAANQEFLLLARAFQYHLDIARPLRNASKSEREEYETFVLLAHRIQTLTPGTTSDQFLRTTADDMFFLRDNIHPHESWADIISRHQQAGRRHLARALMTLVRSWQEHQPPWSRLGL